MTGKTGQADAAGHTIKTDKAPRRLGLVVWFNEPKGYGFIRDESGDEVFVGWSDIVRPGFKTLAEGERVSFLLKAGDGGRKAADVMPLGEPSEPFNS